MSAANHRRAVAVCFIGSTLMFVLGAVVVRRVASGSDGDWLVGLITAFPTLLVAASLFLAGWRVRGRGA